MIWYVQAVSENVFSHPQIILYSLQTFLATFQFVSNLLCILRPEMVGFLAYATKDLTKKIELLKKNV